MGKTSGESAVPWTHHHRDCHSPERVKKGNVRRPWKERVMGRVSSQELKPVAEGLGARGSLAKSGAASPSITSPVTLTGLPTVGTAGRAGLREPVSWVAQPPVRAQGSVEEGVWRLSRTQRPAAACLTAARQLKCTDKRQCRGFQLSRHLSPAACDCGGSERPNAIRSSHSSV